MAFVAQEQMIPEQVSVLGLRVVERVRTAENRDV